MIRPWFAISFLAGAAVIAGPADGASNVVQYTHDGAGNIIAIQRVNPAPMTLAGFTPTSGSSGTTVTITGTGFSALAAQNIVSFNGAAAAVTAASNTSLSAVVPPGASTGRVSVTVAGNGAVSAQEFVVTASGAPSISSFTPASGAIGTVVTVNGANFNPVAGGTTVRLNQNAATVASVTPTSLSFAVPAGTGTGRIRVATPAGSGASSADFIVPPAGIAAADVLATTRLVMDGPARTIGLYATNKYGIVLFDGAVGAWMSVHIANFTITPASSPLGYAIYKPDNTQLASGTLWPTNLSIHLPALPMDGTYSLVLRTGLAQVSLDAKVETNRFIPTDAASLAVAGSAGQSTRLLIAATAGEQRAFMVAGLSMMPPNGLLDAKILLPNGSTFRRTGASGLGTTTPLAPFAVGGTYQVVLTPSGGTTQFACKVAMLVGGSLPIDGPPADVVIASPGEAARLTFAGATGDNVGLGVSGLALNPPSNPSTGIAAYKPDGSMLASTVCGSDGTKCAINLENLPVTGTYTVIVQPANGATGTQRLWLSRDATGALISGMPLSVALARPGQNARLTFAGAAGQTLRISWTGVATIANPTTLRLISPAGSTIGAALMPSNGVGSYDVQALSTTGNHTVFVDPPASATLSATVRIAPR